MKCIKHICILTSLGNLVCPYDSYEEKGMRDGEGLLARTYPFCELNGDESTASSMERRGIEATPFGGRGGVVHGWWSKREKIRRLG